MFPDFEFRTPLGTSFFALMYICVNYLILNVSIMVVVMEVASEQHALTLKGHQVALRIIYPNNMHSLLKDTRSHFGLFVNSEHPTVFMELSLVYVVSPFCILALTLNKRLGIALVFQYSLLKS